MKKILFFALAAACTLNVARADVFTDFGEAYGIWKGDFAVGDINNDGNLDVILSGEENGNEKGGILIGDGKGGFVPQEGERVIKAGQSGNIQLGDIDGDGDLDVIFCGWGSMGGRGIALNDGNGVFTLADAAQYPILETSHGEKKVTSCGFADFNCDGLLDYYFFGNYTVERDENKNEIPGSYKKNMMLYMQNQDGTFTPTEFAAGVEYRLNEVEASLVDFDRDGAVDIWINAGDEAKNCTNKGESQRFSVLFKNDGVGNFTEYNLEGMKFGKGNGISMWTDVDGDGYMDMFHSGDGFLCSGEDNDNVYRVYKNTTTDGVLGLEERYRMEDPTRGLYFGHTATWVDWNGDGILDFIFGGFDFPDKGGTDVQITKLYLGTDSQKFTFDRATGDNYAFYGVSECAYRVADLDNDNRPDLLQCGFGDKTQANRRIAGWVKNTTSPVVGEIEAPTNLNMVYDESGDYYTFTWQAPASLQGKPGITWNLSLYNKTTGKYFYNPMADLATGKRKIGGYAGNVFTNTEYYVFSLPAGEYEWTVQAINPSYLGGKFAAVQTFTVGASGIESVNGYQPEVSVSDRMLNVVGMQGVAQTLNVYNLSGALVNTVSFNGSVNLDMPQAGIYMVEVQAADGGQYITKVVVK